MIQQHICHCSLRFFLLFVLVSSCSKPTVVYLLEVVFFPPCQFLISFSCIQGKPSESPYPGQNCCSVYVDCFSLPATDERQEGVGPEIRDALSWRNCFFASWVLGNSGKSSVVSWQMLVTFAQVSQGVINNGYSSQRIISEF